MKRAILLYLLFAASQLFAQSGVEQLRENILSLIPDNFSNKTITAIDIYDLTDDESLFQMNENLLLLPASTNKLITSVAAIMLLGKEYNFKTELYITGSITDSILNGDVYVHGGFDPDFSLSDLETFSNALSNSGIKKIQGNLYADVSIKDSLYRGSGWMWDDDPSSDAPYLSALNINENTVQVDVIKSGDGSKPEITIFPPSEFFDVVNLVVQDKGSKKDSVKINRDWLNNKNRIIVSGKYIPLKKYMKITSSKINLKAPDLFFLSLLKGELGRKGIELKGDMKINDVPDSAIYLGAVFRPVTEVLEKVNKESFNLGAEMLLYSIGEKYYGQPVSASDGISKIDSLLYTFGFDSTSFRVVDGSGVSRYNLLSASLLNSLLKRIYFNDPPVFNLLINYLPISGIDGTLEYRMKNTDAYGRVKAKTGTLAGVSCLAGYVFSHSGKLISFTIMMQNYIGSSSKARKIQDKICKLLSVF